MRGSLGGRGLVPGALMHLQDAGVRSLAACLGCHQTKTVGTSREVTFTSLNPTPTLTRRHPRHSTYEPGNAMI